MGRVAAPAGAQVMARWDLAGGGPARWPGPLLPHRGAGQQRGLAGRLYLVLAGISALIWLGRAGARQTRRRTGQPAAAEEAGVQERQPWTARGSGIWNGAALRDWATLRWLLLIGG